MTQRLPPVADAFETALLRPAKRRRRKGSPLFTMRLSPDERAHLERLAGETPLATYVKLRLFHNLPDLAALGPSLPGGRPPTDTQLIAKLLSALGASRLPQNLNQLAKAANMGTLDVSKETETELLAAYAEIRAIRADLVTALGKVKGAASA